MDSLKVTDEASAAVAVAPRVSLKDIEAAIAAKFEFTARDAVDGTSIMPSFYSEVPGAMEVPAVLDNLNVLSICLLVMRNGFTVIGKSAPASPENFNVELGRKFAYEDAIRQLWPLMGFSLRDRLREGW